jgi:hypothetical protein
MGLAKVYLSASQKHLWLIKVWLFASPFVVKKVTFAKPVTVNHIFTAFTFYLVNTPTSNGFNLNLKPKYLYNSFSRTRISYPNKFNSNTVSRNLFSLNYNNFKFHIFFKFVASL